MKIVIIYSSSCCSKLYYFLCSVEHKRRMLVTKLFRVPIDFIVSTKKYKGSCMEIETVWLLAFFKISYWFGTT